ncbi:MAG: ABC transporter substrate-binding protein [Tissierellia bacterium]|jgi:peptide/nickel transport system substrate-binding protein|nr:ABC transporter substrate-binding protein [Tissierellia bacterium]
MSKRLVAIVLVVLMVAGLISGCSGKPVTQENNQTPEERTLKLRVSDSVPSLDWEQSTSLRAVKVWHQMFEGLYGMDEAKGGYYKELAKDVSLSDDQLEYTITLQDGVKFQNGEDLKASDVVFSYKRAMKNPRFNYVTSMIEDVAEIDDSTVKVTLKTPFSAIDHTFFSIKIVSEKEVLEQGDKFGTIPHKAGTGPYYVTEYNVATNIKLSAFEDYWRGAPAVKKVEYRVISDDAAAIIAFENNELDYLEDAPLTDWEALLSASGDNNSLTKGNDVLFLGVNYLSPTNNNILANDKVRQAIFYAVNKKDMNSAACNGYGVETPYYMPPEYVATSPKDGFETYEYNKDKAKQLLAEAGYPDGVDVGTILTYGANTGDKAKMAQVLQANLADVGITAEVSVMDSAVVLPRLYDQDYDICIYADSNNFDFNNIRQMVHSESVGMYIVKYKDGPFNWKRLEELVDLGVSTSDIEERVGYYTELWSIVMDSATLLPCLSKPVPTVWASDLEIGTPVPSFYKIRTFSWK